MLRAAARPVECAPASWPVLEDAESCRSWLSEAWALPGFADAIGFASGAFAANVEAVLEGRAGDAKRVRRVTVSVLRYLLRSLGRPTPFGLFAGVGAVQVGGEVQAAWGMRHRLLVRADMLWLDDVIERLEATPGILPHLDVVASDLAADRGDRIEVPRGPGRVTMRNTAVLRLVRQAAAAPVSAAELADTNARAFPGVPAEVIGEVLVTLVGQGLLITNLRAPMTETDPLGHLIGSLGQLADCTGDADRAHVRDLREIQGLLNAHNTSGDPAGQARLRSTAIVRMRRLSLAGRTPLAGDLHLDCDITIPDGLAGEMARSVTALVRLTRRPRPDPAWNDWCREFWDRYGTGAVVPVTEAVHPDAGLGWPGGFPGSMLPEPEPGISQRDIELLRLAWEATAGQQDEIVLTDDVIAAVTADAPVDDRWIPPHVEMAARIRAVSPQALQTGDYTYTVHPAQSFGTLTSRFGPAVANAGLDAVFAATPAGVDGALSVQVSFPPLFPHSENVARIPAHLPDVLSLGEHRAVGDPRVIGVDDLGIVAVADGLHLVSMSRRQVIEPQVFHALALNKQAPPLARFLATLTRGFLARYAEFDWGPAAARLPMLPCVRYGKAILSPATWHLTAADHAAMPGDASWAAMFTCWRDRWNCPDIVELHDEHRSLRLDLTIPAHLSVLRGYLDEHGTAKLTETDAVGDLAWIGGHVHEIVLPFRRATPPAPNLITRTPSQVTNSCVAHRPAAPGSSWLYAQVFTHPERIDDILRVHMPDLLAVLDDGRAWWFARYRSPRETDHLRLRIRVCGPADYASVAIAVGQWGERLCEAGAASRITFATYFPEVGRYGSGAAMNAAERVFAADSRAVAEALRLLPPKVIHPIALVAIGMAALADGFHASQDLATGWLLQHLNRSAAAPDRDAAAQASRWGLQHTLPDGSPLPPEVHTAWQARDAELRQYRLALSDGCDADQVLSALLHMHHNRAHLIDRADEATCRRLARQVALARRARAAGGSG
jgi:thiopeptide-type bacteriocin biosynthesis protein